MIVPSWRAEKPDVAVKVHLKDPKDEPLAVGEKSKHGTDRSKDYELSDTVAALLELLPRIGAPAHHEHTHMIMQDGLPFLIFGWASVVQPVLAIIGAWFPALATALSLNPAQLVVVGMMVGFTEAGRDYYLSQGRDRLI